MMYVISKATFGSYNVRDIQFNMNWDRCPYSDYATIPEALVDGILATQGYCDITLNSEGTEVVSFAAREIPSVSEECCGDNTVLSVNGVKANTAGEVTLNASAVGAAPAGFGLGTGSPNVAVEEISANGWSITNVGTPDGKSWLCHAFVTNAGRDVTVEAWNLDGTTKCKRTKRNNVWREWEYFNPPMVLGVEYPTTEQHMGKTVYTKLVSFAAPAANVNKDVDPDINCDNLFFIRYTAATEFRPLDAYGIPGDESYVAIQVLSKNRTVSFSHNDPCLEPKNTVYIQLWYTKD